MSQHESVAADFYDYQQERGPKRREAADWGGDDLFTSAPRRRRYDRPVRGEHPTDLFERTRRRDTTEHPVQRPVARRASIKAKPQHPLEIPPALDPGRTSTMQAVEPAGRRTVTITGRPETFPARRRPAPTLDERLVGSRPDRVAAYAFALGVLLIVIAFLSANA